MRTTYKANKQKNKKKIMSHEFQWHNLATVLRNSVYKLSQKSEEMNNNGTAYTRYLKILFMTNK